MNQLPTVPRIALIGDDLGSSLSPLIHEAEARHHHQLVGYSYEPLDLACRSDADLGRVLAAARDEGFTGFNITHPYKQSIMAHLDAIAPEAAVLGAVNTVVVGQHGTLGHNTDHTGFRAGLERTLAPETRLQTVVLFGAGGAGSAVAQALLDCGVTLLCLIDPDGAKLESLRALLLASLPADSGARILIGGPPSAAPWIDAADGVVNATPVGMEHIPGTPFDTSLLRPRHWVADVIYRPVVTELLTAASELGCQVIDGTTMLIEQAADTFGLLTGAQPNRERMRRHLAVLLNARGATVPGS